jgi:hypothetical protein
MAKPPKFALIAIESANPAKPRLDLCLAAMGRVAAVEELRGIGDLTLPPLPTSEGRSPRWHPEHHAAPVETRAHKEPLPTAEMTRASHGDDALIEAANLNAEPALDSAAHVLVISSPV